MKGSILRRIAVSIISCFIFTIVASLVFMNDTYGFFFYFIAFLIYASPAIILIGIPFSILMDVLFARLHFKRKAISVGLQVVLYAPAGFIGTWLYFYILALLSSESLYLRDILPLTLFGVIASLLFLICIHGLDFLLDRRREKKNLGVSP